MDLLTTLIYSKNRGIRILRHVLFWITDIASYLSVVSINKEINAIEVYSILLKIIPIILTTYFILYYIIPNFSKLNGNRKLLLLILGVFVFIGVGMRCYNFFFVGPLLGINQTSDFNILDFRLAVRQVFSYMAIICMAVTIKLVKNKTELEHSNQQLLEEKKMAELNFLKAQMQPHFLFNTLNTLYSETIQESGKAQQIVLHLSNLLRFILDECSKPLIPVSQEIKVIRDFIALEQLRHGARLKVNIKIDDIDQHALISPLVFLPFIENSFKHTLTHQRGAIQIDIEIGMLNSNFYLIVQNDLIQYQAKSNGHMPGKGILNVKRQLDLLFGKDYALSINGSQDKYKVLLTIPVKRI